MRRGERAFTLIELLVVVALIAGLSIFLIAGWRDNKAAALQSSQTVVGNLLSAARMRAVASGQGARLLFHIDAESPWAARRYLRYVVLQVSDGAEWTTVSEAYLAPDVYVVPRDPTAMEGLLPEGVAWTRPSDGGTLRSTALRATDEVTLEIGAATVERWAGIGFSERGSTASSGDVVLAVGRKNAGGAIAVVLESPELVRGFALSRYGIATEVSGRAGF